MKKIIIKCLLLIFLPALITADSSKKPLPLAEPVNSAFNDFAPSVTADEKTLVFNSKRGLKYQDIFICYYKNGKWTNPQNIKSINSSYNDETPYITPDGEMIIFASDRDSSLAQPRDSYGRVRVSYDLYWSKKTRSGWSIPQKIPGDVNTINHERAPSLSLDKKTLFYTSWPFGRAMYSRIMKAKYKDGFFDNPEELPFPINTAYQEMTFIPAYDGSGFFFSSNRPGGQGEMDIYFISFDNGIFGQPVNMGKQINSEQNDVFLYKMKNNTYFCSNRQGGPGQYDIYYIASSRQIRFQVRNKKTGEPVSVEVELLIEKKDLKGLSRKSKIKKESNKEGEFIFNVKEAFSGLDISISDNRFLPFFQHFKPENIGDDVIGLELVPVEKGASFDIHAIYFDFNSAILRPESHAFLDSFINYLKKNQGLRFRIIGHTDLHGSDEYNQKLSYKRAMAVRDYIVKNGIDKNRFELEGAGKSRPVVNKISPEVDEKNRRTEFKIIDDAK